MISFLLVIFIILFSTAQIWLVPINWIIGLFIEFSISPSFFIRGAGAVFLSILLTALVLEKLYEKIGWYQLEISDDRYLGIKYRDSIFKPYQNYVLSFRKTKIMAIQTLYWIIPSDCNFTVLLQPPDELEDVDFYEKLDELIDDNYFKVLKQLETIELKDYQYHFMFIKGKIKKFWSEEFKQVTGLLDIHMDDPNYEAPTVGKEEAKEIKSIIDYGENVETIS